MVNKEDEEAIKRCIYIGSRIPITLDRTIEKWGFERHNGYALGSLFTQKVADISVGHQQLLEGPRLAIKA